MTDVLLVGDHLFPGNGSDVGACGLALADALHGAGHRVHVLTLLPEAQALTQAGLAKRLRTVHAHLADGDRTCALFEGACPSGEYALFVLGVDPEDRGHEAAFLANAAKTLDNDKLCHPSVIIAWGETASTTLSSVQATTRLFVLPSGHWSQPLSPKELAALDPNAADLSLAQNSLAGLGAIDADTVVFPSPSSAHHFTAAQEFSYRASDQPVISIQFGCDEPPFDPLTDPTIAVAYGANALTGKKECRKSLAKHAGLALGPRTILLGTSPLEPSKSGLCFLEALPDLARLDIALVIPQEGDVAMTQLARRIAVEFPAKIAVIPASDMTQIRALLAGADAFILLDEDSQTARKAGISMRYATLPIVPNFGAYRDYIIDFDPASNTGNGFRFVSESPKDLLSTIDRVRFLREDTEVWKSLQNHLMHVFPKWSKAGELFGQLMAKPATSVTYEPLKTHPPK